MIQIIIEPHDARLDGGQFKDTDIEGLDEAIHLLTSNMIDFEVRFIPDMDGAQL